MTILHTIILGIVEGFTEFLPISSTAHLIIVSHLLQLGQSDFVKTFEIAIQSGAMLAVVVFFFKKFFDWEILKRIVIAFIPTAIIGLVIYKLAKEYLLGNLVVVLVALFVGGVALIVFERYSKSSGGIPLRSLSYGKTALIGVAQAVAIIPGVSRSAATIVGGSLLGVEKVSLVEFSFLLAVPTILAATGLDVVKNSDLFTKDQAGILILGLVVSFVTALFGIKFLLAYIKKYSFTGFGIYRIVIAVLFLFIFFVL
jgi:undecaprenyl-diphosphatase